MFEKIYQRLIFTIILLICLSAVFPLLYVVSTSLVRESEFVAKNGFVLWPSHPTLAAYQRLFSMETFYNAFLISVARTIIGTVTMLTMTTVTAYVVSRRELPGQRIFMLMVLITILFNGGLIPTFLLLKDLKLINTFWVYIIPGVVDSWSVLVLRQFMLNLPQELEESALLDGCGELTLFSKIIIPLSMPAIAAIAMFAAVGHWNAWFDALIYIDNGRLKTLQLIVRNMLVSNTMAGDIIGTNIGVVLNDPTRKMNEQTMKLALVVLSTIPILMIYPFLQKYFVKGVYIGAIKE